MQAIENQTIFPIIYFFIFCIIKVLSICLSIFFIPIKYMISNENVTERRLKTINPITVCDIIELKT